MFWVIKLRTSLLHTSSRPAMCLYYVTWLESFSIKIHTELSIHFRTYHISEPLTYSWSWDEALHVYIVPICDAYIFTLFFALKFAAENRLRFLGTGLARFADTSILHPLISCCRWRTFCRSEKIWIKNIGIVALPCKDFTTFCHIQLCRSQWRTQSTSK